MEKFKKELKQIKRFFRTFQKTIDIKNGDVYFLFCWHGMTHIQLVDDSYKINADT